MDTTTAQLYDLLVEKGFEKARVREALSEVVAIKELDTRFDAQEDRIERGFAEIKTEIMSLRSEMYRALLIHGFAITGTVIAAAVVLANIFRSIPV